MSQQIWQTCLVESILGCVCGYLMLTRFARPIDRHLTDWGTFWVAFAAQRAMAAVLLTAQADSALRMALVCVGMSAAILQPVFLARAGVRVAPRAWRLRNAMPVAALMLALAESVGRFAAQGLSFHGPVDCYVTRGLAAAWFGWAFWRGRGRQAGGRCNPVPAGGFGSGLASIGVAGWSLLRGAPAWRMSAGPEAALMLPVLVLTAGIVFCRMAYSGRAEEDRRKQIEQSPTATAYSNVASQVLYVNRPFVELFRFADERMPVGRTIWEVLADPSECSQMLTRLWERQVCVGSVEVVRADGSRFRAHVTARVIANRDGHPEGLLWTFVSPRLERNSADFLALSV